MYISDSFVSRFTAPEDRLQGVKLLVVQLSCLPYSTFVYIYINKFKVGGKQIWRRGIAASFKRDFRSIPYQVHTWTILQKVEETVFKQKLQR